MVYNQYGRSIAIDLMVHKSLIEWSNTNLMNITKPSRIAISLGGLGMNLMDNCKIQIFIA